MRRTFQAITLRWNILEMSCRSKHVVCVCVCARAQGKKDVCQIFNNILRRQIGTRSPTVEYFCSHQEVLFVLQKG